MTSHLKAILFAFCCLGLPASADSKPSLTRESLPIDFVTAEKLLRPFVNAFLSKQTGYVVQTYLICVGGRGGFFVQYDAILCLPKDSFNLYAAYHDGEPFGSGVFAKASVYAVFRKADLPEQPIQGDYDETTAGAAWEWGGELSWIEKDDDTLIIGGGAIGIGVNGFAGRTLKTFRALF